MPRRSLQEIGHARETMKGMDVHTLSIAVLVLSACAVKQNKESEFRPHYPPPIPGERAVTFLPDIVSSKELDFNASFSQDGSTFYFSRSHNGKYVVYETRFDGKVWTDPGQSTLFDTRYSNTDPFIADDGSIYFISNRPKDAVDSISDYDIYKIPKGQTGYGEPVILPGINSDSTEYYVSLAQNGNIYFASYRDGNLDLYSSHATAQGFDQPKNMGNINSKWDEHDPLIAADESFIIFTSGRAGGLGEADLYISHQIDGKWVEPVNMGDHINTTSYEYCPYITPDGKFFFYSSELDVKWVDSKILQAYKKR